jgi:uncharacterized protein YjiK
MNNSILTKMACLFLIALVCGAAAADNTPATSGQGSQSEPVGPPLVARFPGEVVGDIDKTRFGEPSGVVFHPARKTLFIVGDEGDLCEMQTDGTVLQKKHYPSSSVRMDFEGITVNPATGLLYIVIEGAEAILEIDPADLAVKREFEIERMLGGELVMASGGQGIEGITFVPNPKLPHGGTFLVANQAFRLEDAKDASAVFEVEVPLADKAGTPPTGKLLRQFSLGVTDLSDLHYDASRNRLYVISDSNDLLFVTTLAGRVIAKYTDLPGADQEGIAFDNAGNTYIAQDSGGVMKIKWSDK